MEIILFLKSKLKILPQYLPDGHGFVWRVRQWYLLSTLHRRKEVRLYRFIFFYLNFTFDKDESSFFLFFFIVVWTHCASPKNHPVVWYTLITTLTNNYRQEQGISFLIRGHIILMHCDWAKKEKKNSKWKNKNFFTSLAPCLY